MNDKVIVAIPLALDAELATNFTATEVVNPPTLYIPVDRIAYETKHDLVMQQIYRRVDRLQKISREKGYSIIELLKEKGWIK